MPATPRSRSSAETVVSAARASALIPRDFRSSASSAAVGVSSRAAMHRPQGRTFVLAQLNEIVQLLDSERELRDILKAKVTAMLTEKKPFVRV